MPVAFIATYAAQKRAFDRQAFGGGDNATEDRWPHLDVKVDTVDRFQGGERPRGDRQPGEFKPRWKRTVEEDSTSVEKAR